MLPVRATGPSGRTTLEIYMIQIDTSSSILLDGRDQLEANVRVLLARLAVAA
jgi:hypothetical protein